MPDGLGCPAGNAVVNHALYGMDAAREGTIRMAARYLGLRGVSADVSEMQDLLARAYRELWQVVQPRVRLCRIPVQCIAEEETVQLGTLAPVQSRSLYRLLADCGEAYVLLSTLGMEVDLGVKRHLLMDVAFGMALGACASAYIDVYLDGVLQLEAETLGAQRAGLTRRFSPGYGDAPLSMQPGLLALCGAAQMGVRLTRGNLMLPEKSVSAVVGIMPEVHEDQREGCKACELKNCAFREDEG